MPLARSGSLHWRKAPAHQTAALQRALARADPEPLARALGVEAQRRIRLFLEGIEAYRHHPYRRRLADPPVLWQEGTTRVLAYGGAASGAPVLLVPSLINRGYILDLTAKRSFARYLSQQGLCPYLVDWDAPGPNEQAFGLDDYVLGRLGAALEAVHRDAGRRVVLVGYCMGGLLTLPLAARPEVAALVLLATPWDFHADGGQQARLIRGHMPMLTGLVRSAGYLPTDTIQTMFATLDPLLAARKFTAFAALDPKSAAACDFVALEDWLNDGVPLSGPVAQSCLTDWYDENAPGTGEWHLGDSQIQLQRIGTPALNVVPARDRIVPPPSAAALSDGLPNVETWTPALGHIGMMASTRAKRVLWRRLVEWMQAHADEAA